MQNIVGIVCDCDGTLCPDTTESLLRSNNIEIDQFWKKIDDMIGEGWDPPLAWMGKILNMIKDGKIVQNTNDKLKEFGKQIQPFDGVPDFIQELNKKVSENEIYAKEGVKLEWYVVSSGFENLIRGTVLNKHFKDIFGAAFDENEKGEIISIKSTVTFTEKTKFIFAINKGITGEELKKNPGSVNEIAPVRRIPFKHMIYLGDGPTDIPCFSMIEQLGGTCIGLMGDTPKSLQKGLKIAQGRRLTVGPYSQNYKVGSDLRKMLETIIDELCTKIAAESKLQKRNKVYF